jgi:ketosteroid isomerase-like protein
MIDGPSSHPDRPMRLALAALAFALTAGACTAPAPRLDAAARAVLEREVADTERAFAATMAARDHAAFVRFLSPEAVFFSGPEPLRGADAVAAYWLRFYEAPQAPFSWTPAEVQVLDSGTLALSSGPVLDPSGRPAGTFTSIWRRDGDGRWRIVFDKGGPACETAR